MKNLKIICFFALLSASCTGSSTAKPKLIVFVASDPRNVTELQTWYCETMKQTKLKGLDNEATALSRLRDESCNRTLHNEIGLEIAENGMTMCDAYNDLFRDRSINCPKKVLNEADCLAVKMYSSNFYGVYNTNLRKGKWQPYKVFTNLLHSALVKLSDAETRDPKKIITLYKGLNIELDLPPRGSIYFKQFQSTTTELKVALQFGRETVLLFQIVRKIAGADISSLSIYPGEKEVLISPFEAFQFVNTSMRTIMFKTVDNVEIHDAQCKI